MNRRSVWNISMGAAIAGVPLTFFTLSLGVTPYLIGTWTLVALMILLFISVTGGSKDYVVTVLLEGMEPDEYHFYSQGDVKSFLVSLIGLIPKGATVDLNVDDWKNVKAVVMRREMAE